MATNKDIKVDIVERITESDKAVLDLAKAKIEIALANAKTALLYKENEELKYNNIILQFALSYHLKDGDTIVEDGSIKRKVEEK